MTRYEREALAAIRDEHKQTRRAVSERMIAIACNATAQAERQAVAGALRRLREKGMVSASPGGYVPTTRGLCADLADEAPVVMPEPTPEPQVVTASARHPAVPRELLHRCAAMHSALFVEVKAAYDRGEAGAAEELAWLVETGEQLLAAGGEA
ncbi:hypothetical protein RAN53_09465 [Halomonas sp. SSL-5]|uniref:hypothetical protein n=1 Tax=Halomonas sp. SSL-5 TaxID=3065855 RepID=UPI0027390868|nr:hypothetical protein [Halomonas sp. SSL-5]MDY7116578.1 hypothetical protein [Halomonas sp. SSL-5]